jgi:FecR protein
VSPWTRLPVEVEPFSEPRWARVERDVFADLDELPRMNGSRTRGVPRGLRYVLAVAALVAAVVALATRWPDRPPSLSDAVRLATRESASRFTIGESSIVAAADSLVLVRGDDEHGVNVVVDHGRIDCEVAPRRGRPPFVVDAGEVRVMVVGTGFSVTHDARRTAVQVSHGTVEVLERGDVTTLHDGERWEDDGTVSGASPLAPTGATTASASSSVVDGAAPATTSEAATPASEARPARPSESPGSAASLQPWPDDDDPDPELANSAAIARQPSPDERAFNAAARVERRDPDGAAAVYRRIAADGSEWAPTALFALAQLEAKRGHRREAIDLLRAYLAQYPRAINADDAREYLRRLQ